MWVKRTTVIFRRSELIPSIGPLVVLLDLDESSACQTKTGSCEHLPTAWKLILASFSSCNRIK